MSRAPDPKSKPTPAARGPRPEPRAGRVALVGRPNAGKSTLLNALVGERLAITSHHPQTTREAVRGVLTTDDAQFVFVDTPGVHAARTRLGRYMNDAALQHARDADAVVLVAEASGARPHAADLALAADLPAAGVVLALNKVDLVPDKGAILPLLAAFAEARPFSALVPLSAKRDPVPGAGGRRAVGRAGAPSQSAGGLVRLLDELRALLPEQPFLFEPDTLSDQPERFFVAELVREQVLRHTRQEVPHGVAVVVEAFDDQATPRRIEATIHVAREAHKKIVVGAGGRMLKSIGTAARAQVERVLGGRVHLALRVHATPDWMNDEARLREFGYGRLDA